MQAWTRAGHEALGRPDLADVRRLEALASRSWPPLEVAPLGGWVLRAAGGVTRRSNSAWPRDPGTLTVDQQLRATVAWYERRDQVPCIQLSPSMEPADLDDRLDGWAVEGETLVLRGPVVGGPQDGVRIDPVPGEDWLDVAARTTGRHFGGTAASSGRAALQAIAKPCAYAVAHVGDEPVAVARAVLDGDHVGVASLATLPEHRRAGHARRVLDALGGWAVERGATVRWLAVEAENAPALRLYAGMEPVFTYAFATRR